MNEVLEKGLRMHTQTTEVRQHMNLAYELDAGIGYKAHIDGGTRLRPNTVVRGTCDADLTGGRPI